MNLRGDKRPFAPEYGSALVCEHYFQLANGARLVPRLQAKYQSEMFLIDFNRPSDAQEAYARTDVSLRYEAQPGAGASPDSREWRARFFDVPRTYGVRAVYRFE